MLYEIGLEYEASYKTIADSNIGSQKAAFANGYVALYRARKSKILHTIHKSENAGLKLYAVIPEQKKL